MKKVAKFSPIAERPTNDDGQLEALTPHLQSRRKSEKRVHRKVSAQFKSDSKRWQQLLSSTASSSTGLVHELPALSNPTWAVHRSSLTEGLSGVETNIVHMMTKLRVGTSIQAPSHSTAVHMGRVNHSNTSRKLIALSLDYVEQYRYQEGDHISMDYQ